MLGCLRREYRDFGGYRNLVATNKVQATDGQSVCIEIGLHAMTGDGLKLSHPRDGDPPLSGACDDRLGDWVLGVLLDAGGKPQSLALFDSCRRMRRDDLVLPERQRARLVEHHRVE